MAESRSAPRLLFAVLVCWNLAACGRNAEPPPPPPPEVGVIEVETETVDLPFPRIAQVESSREVEVVARVSGFLERIVYKEGALVQQGDVMFEMDKRPFEARLKAAKGELEASKARLWTANANLDRIRPLAEADAMSQSDLDQAIGEKQAAEAAVYAAEAAVTSAELDLSYATIHAPVTGLTGQARQREGAYLNAMSESANLSYVAQIEPIWVNIAVSQNELERRRAEVQAGLIEAPPDSQYVFEILLADGTVFPHRGRIDFAAPSFDPATGTFAVRAEVPNPDFTLRPGMFVTANVLGARRPNAVVVPQVSVQQTAQGQIVWLVSDDGKAEARPVKTGEWVDQGWVVESGLSGGETLVVEGFQKLRPGVPVKAVPYRAGADGDKESPKDAGAGRASATAG